MQKIQGLARFLACRVVEKSITRVQILLKMAEEGECVVSLYTTASLIPLQFYSMIASHELAGSGFLILVLLG